MDAILPAAGLSSRMRGIPKFLLPVDIEYTTLLEHHLENLSLICENIFLPTRKDLISLIESLEFNNDKLKIIEMQSETMSETVINTIDSSDANHFILTMPDTFFTGESPFELLDREPLICEIACWKIRDEQRGKLGEVLIDENNSVLQIVDKKPDNGFEFAWGALTFSKELIKYIDIKDPHIGYAVANALEKKEVIKALKLEGKYYDCGTPQEYLKLLEETFIKK